MVLISKVSRAERKVEKKKMPVGAKIFDIAFTVFVYLLAVVILLGAIIFAFNTSSDKSLFGFRYYNVITPSMEPKYKVGDVVFVKVCGADEVDVDDVITYNPDANDRRTYLTHRVVKKYTEEDGTVCFITKGDANKTSDAAPIDEGRLIGKVTFGVPKLGYIIEFVRAKWYFIVIIAILIGVFFKLLKHYFMMGKEEDDDEDGKKDKDKKKLPENEGTDSENSDNKSEGDEESLKPDQEGESSGETEVAEAPPDAGESAEAAGEENAGSVEETSETGSEDGSSSEDEANETSQTDE